MNFHAPSHRRTAPRRPSARARLDGSQTSVVLLNRARRGHPRAQEKLFAGLQDDVHRLVRRRMGKRLRLRLDSMDIVQSVLAEAVAKLPRLRADHPDDVHRWARRVAENKVRRKARDMRHGDRNPDRQVPIGPRSEDGRCHDPAGDDASPPRELIRNEEQRSLRDHLERLTPRARLLVQLRMFQQRSWDEILERTGEPNLDAARKAFSRGVAKLASSLAHGS